MKTIRCQKCGNPITSRYDLVTKSSGFLFIAPYHLECYARGQKGLQAAPALNGEGMLAGIIIIAAVCAIAIVRTHWWVFAFMALVLPAIRLASWTIYERHLP